jgi:isoleucyl-tRNA synthetase
MCSWRSPFAVVRQLGEFANGTLSTIYFTAIKDVLYSDALSSPRRRACIAVLDQVSADLRDGEAMRG